MADIALGGRDEAPDAPRVSVIIIFLNPLPYLHEAIESVMRQSLDDWELLLVDDGSSDGSTEAAHEYAAAHPGRIRYYEHPGHENLGMSASRNLGLRHARGRYVAFLDGDDVYMPQRLERHVAILDASPQVDMVQSELVLWYSWQPPSQRICDDQWMPFLAATDRVIPPPEGLLMVLAEPMLRTGICNITVRRSVALELAFEPRFRGLHEDQAFLAKIYLEKTVYVLQEYLAKYRRHPASLVRRMKTSGEFVVGLANTAEQALNDFLRDYVAKLGVRHPLLDEALARLPVGAPKRESLTRRVSGRVLTEAKELLLRFLPRALYRRLLHLSWQRRVAHALREYQRLRARIEGSTRAGSTA
jgi:glycosyltransferase involved in cell wall biosynthesis